MGLANDRLQPVSGGKAGGGGFYLVWADLAGEALDALENFVWPALQVEDVDFDFDVLVGSPDVVNRRTVFAVGIDEEGAGKSGGEGVGEGLVDVVVLRAVDGGALVLGVSDEDAAVALPPGNVRL